MELFNLGESGVIDSFLTKVKKQLSRDIATLKQNLKIETMKYQHLLEKLNDDLEDAEKALQDAYLKIDTDSLSTNAAQTKYVPNYLEGIGNAKRKVKKIQEEIENLKEDFSEEKKKLYNKIKTREADLAIISAE
jgi:uncharacterized protein YgfB (UPF0149 family)